MQRAHDPFFRVPVGNVDRLGMTKFYISRQPVKPIRRNRESPIRIPQTQSGGLIKFQSLIH